MKLMVVAALAALDLAEALLLETRAVVGRVGRG